MWFINDWDFRFGFLQSKINFDGAGGSDSPARKFNSQSNLYKSQCLMPLDIEAFSIADYTN
jgi:hypothetical protein